MHQWRIGLMVAVVSVWVSGCSSTTMRTARQLEAGDLVASGGLDGPGFLYVPRLSGQVMYGLGAGDVSVHGGTTVVTFNAGLGARAYLGERWTAGLQLDANGVLPTVSNELDFGGLYSGNLQLTNSARGKFGFYGGPHIAVHTAGFSSNFSPPVINTGLVGGLDLLIADNFGLQIEARASPLYYDIQEGLGFIGPLTGDASGGSLFTAQIGISLYKRWSAAPALEGTVQEERWNDPDNDLAPKGRKNSRPAPEQQAPPSSTAPKKVAPEPTPGGAPVPPPPDR